MRGVRRLLACACVVVASTAPHEPASAAAACGPLTFITSLDLISVSGGRPGVPAKIGDKPVTLLVDTGGALSMISRSVVRELNLPIGQSLMSIRNVAGQISRDQVRLPSIMLGTLRQEGAYFMIDPNDLPSDQRSFHGVIAPDFLMNVDVDFDFGAKKLNLVSPNHCAGKVIYWAAPALAVVPFRIDRSGHISFRLELDGKRVNAILDTGASTTTLNLNLARRTFDIDTNGPDVEKIGAIEGGYTADIFRKRFKTIAIDGVQIINPVIDLLPDLMSGPGMPPQTGSLIRNTDDNLPDVILGMNVLSKMHVYIAYKETKLYITEAPPPASAPAPPATPQPQ